MRIWIRAAAYLGVLALTIYLTSYFARLPESNCVNGEVGKFASNDGAYTATLLKKDCGMGETIFYSVRIDKIERSPAAGWFLREDLEQDGYPAIAIEPTIKWEAHQLEIAIPAKELAGSIQRRVDDLTIVRSYIRPDAK
jgi:hypothetical protein